MIRSLRVARQTAIRSRTQAINALKALLVTAPAELHEQLRDLPNRHPGGSRGRPGPGPDHQPTGGGHARTGHPRPPPPGPQPRDQGPHRRAGPAHRHRSPQLVALLGIGQDNAGALLVAAGDNPQRLRNEACFAMLCGSSPIQASSGKTVRHRLNRGGDRQANAALYRIVLVRLRYHQPTKDYLTRRLAEGKPKNEIIRCLKRYIARDVFAAFQPLRHEFLTPPS
jgi:transposase